MSRSKRPILVKLLTVAALAACTAGLGCGLDGELIGAATDRGHVALPQPNDTVLHGRATPVAGGAIGYYTASGSALESVSSAVASDGFFQQRFAGVESHHALLLWGALGDRVVLGVLPELPRQPTVFHAVRQLAAWDGHASLADLNAATTAMALVTMSAARQQSIELGGLDGRTIGGTLDDVVAGLQSPGSKIAAFAQMVARLDAAAATSAAKRPIYKADALLARRGFLDPAWLATQKVDYTGDGAVDTTVDAFDAALEDAAAEIGLGVCFAEERMKVVFHLDLRAGVRNRNCTIVDAYKWASNQPGKTAFFTGGVHEDTPVCGADRSDHCITNAQIDAVNGVLGNWVPNIVAMADDGSGDDLVAGDGIWTFSVELPYIATSTSPDGAGLRIGYKYTLGNPGQDWTDSEEWPGNQRLLEIEDLNGDGLATRYDIFGDESANKDKVNTFKLAKGGCGTVDWEAVRPADCAGDSRENRVDTDGDCVEDAWEDPRPASPATIPCPD